MKLRTKLIVAFMSVMILPMIFLNVVMHTFASREVGELQQLYMIVVFITTTLLIYWIYRSVSVPLAKLQKAARNIKEGNLDFEIRQESDDEIGQLCQDFEEMRLRLKANAEEKVAFDRENKELISNIFPRSENTDHGDQRICGRNHGRGCGYPRKDGQIH